MYIATRVQVIKFAITPYNALEEFDKNIIKLQKPWKKLKQVLRVVAL